MRRRKSYVNKMKEILIDRWNRKKLKMKTLKKKIRKKNPVRPTNGKSEKAWKNVKGMFHGK